MINQRIFSANVGDSSVGIAGPDAIEQDIDNLLANDQELLGQINNLDAAKADLIHEHTKSDITDFPSSLPADGGNADTVGGKTIWVGAEGSKGTDANTIYFCY
jgi:hypothetical protein